MHQSRPQFFFFVLRVIVKFLHVTSRQQFFPASLTQFIPSLASSWDFPLPTKVAHIGSFGCRCVYYGCVAFSFIRFARERWFSCPCLVMLAYTASLTTLFCGIFPPWFRVRTGGSFFPMLGLVPFTTHAFLVVPPELTANVPHHLFLFPLGPFFNLRGRNFEFLYLVLRPLLSPQSEIRVRVFLVLASFANNHPHPAGLPSEPSGVPAPFSFYPRAACSHCRYHSPASYPFRQTFALFWALVGFFFC